MALIIRAISLALRCLPLEWSLSLGERVGRLFGALATELNRTVQSRLALRVEGRTTAKLFWSDLGRRAVEFVLADRLLDRVDVSSADEARFQDALNSGRGVLCATTHLGNWELMAAALAARGYRVQSVASGKTGPLGDLLSQHRRRLGVTEINPGRGARQVVTKLVAGEAIGLFVDQHTRGKGSLHPFLGETAQVSSIPERLLRITGAVPVFIWNHRKQDGRYQVHVESVPENNVSEWLNDRVAAIISTYPAQWVWVHDRWRAGETRQLKSNRVVSAP